MAIESLQLVLDALDYSGAEGLVRTDQPNEPGMPAGRMHVWEEAQEKFGLDAAYFLGSIPVVYFKGLSAASDEDLANLHRQLWNHNRVPLLVAVLPEEVRVYNCFAPPDPARGAGAATPTLLQTVRLAADVLELASRLEPFRRQEVEAGRLVRDSTHRFARDQRVDQRLVHNLKVVRRRLMDATLDPEVINSLLGRSYLLTCPVIR
jgi:hypothetical protein